MDPLWSTIFGFVAVHELRKRELLGPVADDILYAGIIAVNVGRSPGLQDLAGKGIDAVGMIGAAATGLVAGKVLSGSRGVGGAAGSAAVGAKAASAGLLLPASVAAIAVGELAAGYMKAPGAAGQGKQDTKVKGALWKAFTVGVLPAYALGRALKGLVKK